MDKITEQDLANRGVKGLPDVPGLTTEEMQRKLEEIAREILIPKVNELVEGLNNANSNLNEKTLHCLFGTYDVTTTTNYNNEYQGSVTRGEVFNYITSNIPNAVEFCTICVGGNNISDGSVLCKVEQKNGLSDIYISGTMSGTYQLNFIVLFYNR